MLLTRSPFSNLIPPAHRSPGSDTVMSAAARPVSHDGGRAESALGTENKKDAHGAEGVAASLKLEASAGWRVVAVAVPLGNTAIARVYAMLDANPGHWFAPEDLAKRLQMNAEIVRQQCNDLRLRGLAESKPRTGHRTWLYSCARDFSDALQAMIRNPSAKDAA